MSPTKSLPPKMGPCLSLPKSLPPKLRALNSSIMLEHGSLDEKFDLPLSFKKKCTKYIIEVLDYLLQNYEKLDWSEYLDYLNSYHLQFEYNSKGEEVPGIMLSDSDKDISTDYLIGLQLLKLPDDIKKIKKIRDRFEEFLNIN